MCEGKVDLAEPICWRYRSTVDNVEELSCYADIRMTWVKRDIQTGESSGERGRVDRDIFSPVTFRP